MTKTVYIWGCSDDLVEITGDVEEEFYGSGGYIVFDNGTMLKVSYDGDWTIVEDIQGKNTCIRYRKGSPEAIEITDGRDYSDVVKVEGGFNLIAMSEKVINV